FRNTFVNTLVKGAKNSQHLEGKAMDIDGEIYGGITNSEIFNWLKANVVFDQLIWEYGDDVNPSWVHVSWNKNGNRNEVLRIK
ncbi:D-Ala-D-Ala carboxypeptidase family metallohydrolase, partial [Staphylococcus aureus]|uniref:D-Ala-D-Ala carboxypeptidase family metallohydrolase n=1 Tax=Staphylococcus aureus TaxID=1280 RepID=UPI0039BDD5D2